MSRLRIIEYDGSDEQILKLLRQASGPALQQIAGATNDSSSSQSVWDDVAKQFHKHVSETASAGRPAQRNAMLAWLKGGGTIELTALWGAAGVKTQHDYSGVGGSLTKNMIKSGGPRNWYRYRRNSKGEWIYTIIDGLSEALKRAFGFRR